MALLVSLCVLFVVVTGLNVWVCVLSVGIVCTVYTALVSNAWLDDWLDERRFYRQTRNNLSINNINENENDDIVFTIKLLLLFKNYYLK